MRNGGQWTESRYNSFIKSALRSASKRWPPKFTCLNNSFTQRTTNPKTGKLCKMYRCASCSGEFPAKDVQIDHIDPVIDPNMGFVSWDEVVKRMFCEADGYQTLCMSCHKDKTNKEKELTKKRKQNGKE